MANPNSAILVVAAGLSLASGWGATWNQVNSGLPGVSLGVNALTIDPVSPSTIYARSTGIPNGSLSLNTGLFKSTDAGANWTDISSGLSVITVAIDPKNTATLYAGTNQGIAKSTNGGASWIDASTGLSDGSVIGLAIDPQNPSTIYAVMNNAGAAFPPAAAAPVSNIFKSTNGGASWTALNTGIPPGGFANVLVIDPASPATLYILVPSFGLAPGAGGPPIGGVFKSTDGGENWRMLNTGLPPGVLISFLAVTPSALYALVPTFGGGPGNGPPVSAISKSTDGGETWQIINSDLASATVFSFFLTDPTAPSTFYAAGQTFVPGGPPSFGIFKSLDAGQHWSTLNIGVPMNVPITSVVIDPLTPSRLYAGFTDFNSNGGPSAIGSGVAGGGILQSTDGGAPWTATGG
jgi:photosystem II stability/assembly factor-like uncharacterized protein